MLFVVVSLPVPLLTDFLPVSPSSLSCSLTFYEKTLTSTWFIEETDSIVSP